MMTTTVNVYSTRKPTIKAEMIGPSERESRWLTLHFKSDVSDLIVNFFAASPEAYEALSRIADAINKESACLNPQPLEQSPSVSMPTSTF